MPPLIEAKKDKGAYAILATLGGIVSLYCGATIRPFEKRFGEHDQAAAVAEYDRPHRTKALYWLVASGAEIRMVPVYRFPEEEDDQMCYISEYMTWQRCMVVKSRGSRPRGRVWLGVGLAVFVQRYLIQRTPKSTGLR